MEDEEAAHGVAEPAAADGMADAFAEPTERDASAAESSHAASAGVSGSEDKVERVLAEHLNHARKDGLVMLHVRVHDADVAGGACEDTFDAGRG